MLLTDGGHRCVVDPSELIRREILVHVMFCNRCTYFQTYDLTSGFDIMCYKLWR
jgi:hypothetical protein